MSPHLSQNDAPTTEVVYADRECTCQEGTPYFVQSPEGPILYCDECQSVYFSARHFSRGRKYSVNDSIIQPRLPQQPYTFATLREVKLSPEGWGEYMGLRLGLGYPED